MTHLGTEFTSWIGGGSTRMNEDLHPKTFASILSQAQLEKPDKGNK